MKLIAGREYAREFPTDTKESIIVNEALVKKFGMEDPVGKTIKKGLQDRTIIGVVQNFHFRSLHHEVEPTVLSLGTYTGRLWVRIRPENVPGTIAFIKEQWKKVAPNQIFLFSFIDEDLDEQYKKEERWNLMIQYATGFAIFIAATRRIRTGCSRHNKTHERNRHSQSPGRIPNANFIPALTGICPLCRPGEPHRIPHRLLRDQSMVANLRLPHGIRYWCILTRQHSHVPRRTHNRHRPDPQSRPRKPGGCIER